MLSCGPVSQEIREERTQPGITSSCLALAGLDSPRQGPCLAAARGSAPFPAGLAPHGARVGTPRAQHSPAALRGGGVRSPPCSIPPSPPRIGGSPGFCFPRFSLPTGCCRCSCSELAQQRDGEHGLAALCPRVGRCPGALRSPGCFCLSAPWSWRGWRMRRRVWTAGGGSGLRKPLKVNALPRKSASANVCHPVHPVMKDRDCIFLWQQGFLPVRCIIQSIFSSKAM